MKKIIISFINIILTCSITYALDIDKSVDFDSKGGRTTDYKLLEEVKSKDFAYAKSNNGNQSDDNVTLGAKDNNEPISFSESWARASSTSNSAIYLKIKNNSYTNYTLVGASAISVANDVEIHQSYVDEKGVSRMTSIDKILIPGQTEVELKPGGMHIMLFDLKRILKVGDKFKLNLSFETLGTKTIDVVVQDPQN